MNRAYGWMLASTLVTSFGCGPVVTTSGTDPETSGSSGDPGTGGSGTTTTNVSVVSTGTTTPPPPQSLDIAEVKGDVLEISLASFSQQCGADNNPPCGPSDTWQVSLGVPVAQLVVGTVLSLKDVQGFATGSTASDGSGFCGGGGGTFWDGTVEIRDVSDTAVTIRLSGTATPFFGTASADGDYQVALCGPAAPPPHLLTSAVASPNEAPDALTLIVTNVPNSCADPMANQYGCTQDVVSVQINLSPAMQAVGTYPITQNATSSSWGPGANGECVGGGGTYSGGSVQILSIDPSQVVFTLSGTSDLFHPHGTADGTYTAPRCN